MSGRAHRASAMVLAPDPPSCQSPYSRTNPQIPHSTHKINLEILQKISDRSCTLNVQASEQRSLRSPDAFSTLKRNSPCPSNPAPLPHAPCPSSATPTRNLTPLPRLCGATTTSANSSHASRTAHQRHGARRPPGCSMPPRLYSPQLASSRPERPRRDAHRKVRGDPPSPPRGLPSFFMIATESALAKTRSLLVYAAQGAAPRRFRDQPAALLEAVSLSHAAFVAHGSITIFVTLSSLSRHTLYIAGTSSSVIR